MWIDPLDGTNDFTRGNVHFVTVLIGLSVNGVPKAGVIHKPFKDGNLEMSETYFGSLETGSFRWDFDPQKEHEE